MRNYGVGFADRLLLPRQRHINSSFLIPHSSLLTQQASVEAEDLLKLGLCAGDGVHFQLEDVLHIVVPAVNDRAIGLRFLGELYAFFALIVAENLVIAVKYTVVADACVLEKRFHLGPNLVVAANVFIFHPGLDAALPCDVFHYHILRIFYFNTALKLFTL